MKKSKPKDSTFEVSVTITGPHLEVFTERARVTEVLCNSGYIGSNRASLVKLRKEIDSLLERLDKEGIKS